jgi:hypothetical protein
VRSAEAAVVRHTDDPPAELPAPSPAREARELDHGSIADRSVGAPFIGTRPLRFPVTLRGQVVDLEVRPAVGTTTHVNCVITISRGSKVLDWVPSRAELASIGRTAGMRTEIQTSH